MTGQLEYMVISMAKFLFIISFLFLQFPLLISDTTESKFIKKPSPSYLIIDDPDSAKNNINLIEKEYQIISDSLAIKHNNDPRFLDLERIGNYVYETQKGSLHSYVNRLVTGELNEPVFYNRHLRVLVDINENIFFTDGSIIVYFNEELDLSNFSKSYGVVLKRAFPSSNAAVFSTPLDNIEDTMNLILENDSVKFVNFDVIDPSILPQ